MFSRSCQHSRLPLALPTKHGAEHEWKNTGSVKKITHVIRKSIKCDLIICPLFFCFCFHGWYPCSESHRDSQLVIYPFLSVMETRGVHTLIVANLNTGDLVNFHYFVSVFLPFQSVDHFNLPDPDVLIFMRPAWSAVSSSAVSTASAPDSYQSANVE